MSDQQNSDQQKRELLILLREKTRRNEKPVESMLPSELDAEIQLHTSGVTASIESAKVMRIMLDILEKIAKKDGLPGENTEKTSSVL